MPYKRLCPLADAKDEIIQCAQQSLLTYPSEWAHVALKLVRRKLEDQIIEHTLARSRQLSFQAANRVRACTESPTVSRAVAGALHREFRCHSGVALPSTLAAMAPWPPAAGG